MSMRYHLTPKSANAKTGPIPVSTSTAATCADACPLKRDAAGKVQGCYADGGPLGMHWAKVTSGERGDDWATFVGRIAALPDGQLWRHNQAGDLPGIGDALDVDALRQLVSANAGKRGFTYTHKPLLSAEERDAIRDANAAGFRINLSANSLDHADTLYAMGIGPVAVVLAADQNANTTTPGGRKVIVCPATQRDDVSCASCQLCQRERSVIVGFPAHGASAKRATKVTLSYRGKTVA